MTLTDASTMTCLANDLGYENCFAWQIEVHANPYDTLVCISSSGESMNMRLAATVARKLGATVVTLTGFEEDNPLRSMGHHNYYVPSSDYGVVECAHLAILHSLATPT